MFPYILVVYTMYSSFVLAYFKREGEKKTSNEVVFSDFISTFAMSSRVSYAFCDTKICEISAMTKS